MSLLAAPRAAFSTEASSTVPSEMVRYTDAATETPVWRLTDPAHHSTLPAYYTRSISRHGNFLLYSSDRMGSMQAWRMDLRSGESRRLTDTRDLLPATINLMPDEKSCCFISDGVLRQLNLSSLREREIYRVPAGFEACDGLAISADGSLATFAERSATVHRIMLVNLIKGQASTVLKHAEEITDPMLRPGRASVLYRLAQQQLRVTTLDGHQDQVLRTPSGGLGPAFWSQDGRSLDYLHFPSDGKQLHTIREYAPDNNQDRLVAATSQFVQFGRNADSSVYVGASGSKAAPYVLLLVRAVGRELTLCEHRASDPVRVAPVFSPNSQRIFFHSDQHGKWAIYGMQVDRLVAETDF